MILAIDIGKTNIVLGCVEGKKTYFIERLSTDKAKTELEYAVSLKNGLELYEIPVEQIEGGIISSVVPQVTELCRDVYKRQLLVRQSPSVRHFPPSALLSTAHIWLLPD